MVACIIAVIIIGAALVGVMTYYGAFGGTHINGGDWNNTTTFTFQNNNPSAPATMTIDIELDVGDVNVTFTDDPTLIAKVNVEVPNITLDTYGEPSVEFSDTAVVLHYRAARVTMILGNSSAYTFNLDIVTGAVNLTTNEHARVRGVGMQVTTGSIDASFVSDMQFVGNVSVVTTVTTGAISITVSRPTGVGMLFTGSVSTGNVDVTTTTWTLLTQNIYQTSDYDSASQQVALTASVTTGGITAILA